MGYRLTQICLLALAFAGGLLVDWKVAALTTSVCLFAFFVMEIESQ